MPPSDGRDVVLKSMLIFFGLIVGLIVLIGSGDTPPASAPDAPRGLWAEVSNATGDEFSAAIEGIAHNDTDHHYRYLQIEFQTYDQGGNITGKAIDNVNDLPPGGTWRFRALAFDRNASRFSRTPEFYGR